MSARSGHPHHQGTPRNAGVSSQRGNPTASILATILSITSQTVLITALLYYYGWVRTRANFGYFGVDTSLLGFTTADYVLRSINSAFPPLTGFALLVLLLLSFHRWVLARVVTAPTGTPADKAVKVCLSTAPALSTVLGAVVFIGLVFPSEVGEPLGLVLPLMLVALVGILGYSWHLRALRFIALGGRGDSQTTLHVRVRTGVLATIGMVGILWSLALYAAQVGERAAVDSVATLPYEPEITLYSSDRIALNGPGIVVSDITQTGSRYRYCYSGLRLLIHSGDQYILIPVGWRKGRDNVFLVPGNETIRLDMAGSE